MTQTTCRVVVDGETCEDILSFDYSSDVLAIAEEAHFVVENKGHKWRDALKIGQRVEFILAHPEVNGGAPTVKHRGIITRRNPRVTPGDGSTIAVTSSDLGWFLQNNCAPLWMRLQGRTYADLCDPATYTVGRDGKRHYFLDPSWGFTTVRFDGDIRASLKMGLAVVKANAQRLIDPVHVVQIEPGDKVADTIVTYAKRKNLLLNVAPDGALCCFRPRDKQKPTYHLRLRDGDPENNVLEAQAVEDARTRYTEVTVVGEQVGYEGPQDPSNPNAGKKRGHVVHPGNFPALLRLTAADGEMFQNGLAQKQAEWLYKRGQFDAFSATYKVAEHHQNGAWLESDFVASVQDDELGLYGNLYVQAVRCSGSRGQADTTEVTLRMPGLLSAAFGELPSPPLYRAGSSTGTPKAAP